MPRFLKFRSQCSCSLLPSNQLSLSQSRLLALTLSYSEFFLCRRSSTGGGSLRLP